MGLVQDFLEGGRDIWGYCEGGGCEEESGQGGGELHLGGWEGGRQVWSEDWGYVILYIMGFTSELWSISGSLLPV